MRAGKIGVGRGARPAGFIDMRVRPAEWDAETPRCAVDEDRWRIAGAEILLAVPSYLRAYNLGGGSDATTLL